MEYVKIIKRVSTLQHALPRAYAYAKRHDHDITVDIDFKIEDKITELKDVLKLWIGRKENGLSVKERCNRRNQIRTACRLLTIDYGRLME